MKDMKDAWVVFHRRTGRVSAVYFREPHWRAVDARAYGVIRTFVSSREIARAPDLMAVGRAVMNRFSLAGI